MPRFTHLVVSSGESSHVEWARQLRRRTGEVRTEAHCKSADEAESALRDCQHRETSRVYGVIELAKPIEY